jgi:hypothetical protein
MNPANKCSPWIVTSEVPWNILSMADFALATLMKFPINRTGCGVPGKLKPLIHRKVGIINYINFLDLLNLLCTLYNWGSPVFKDISIAQRFLVTRNPSNQENYSFPAFLGASCNIIGNTADFGMSVFEIPYWQIVQV